MDFPWIYWLLPAGIFSPETRQWVVENWPCALGGYCY